MIYYVDNKRVCTEEWEENLIYMTRILTTSVEFGYREHIQHIFNCELEMQHNDDFSKL